MSELVGQTQAQAEALAREWCCWDAIDGSFAGSLESTMSTCLVLREEDVLVDILVGYVEDI